MYTIFVNNLLYFTIFIDFENILLYNYNINLNGGMFMKIQKFFIIFISFVICMIFMIPNLLTVRANESRYYNYSTNFTLSGDGAADMVKIGMPQKDRTGDSLGYNEAWCADFISDCAILANQSSIIPFNGNVTALRSSVLQAGGNTVSTPKAGDLVCYYCHACGRYVHVGLMTDSQHSIQGNYGDKVSYVATPSQYWDTYRHDCSSGTVVYDFVRPNYISSYLSTTLGIYEGTSSTSTIFYWNYMENVVTYNLRIFDKNGNEYSVWNLSANETLTEVELPAGSYTAYIDTCFSDSYIQSNIENFVILENAKIYSEKNEEYTKVKWNGIPDAQVYNVRISQNGYEYISFWNLTETEINLILPKGDYDVYIDTIFSDGTYRKSNTLTLSFLHSPNLSVNISNLLNNATFKWTISKYVNNYNLRIFNENNDDYSIWSLNDDECSCVLPVGKYHAYVDYVYDKTYYAGEIVEFEINSRGDINQDSEFNITDVLILQKYLHCSEKLTKEQFELADINQDNRVNVYDLVLLKKKLLNGK